MEKEILNMRNTTLFRGAMGVLRGDNYGSIASATRSKSATCALLSASTKRLNAAIYTLLLLLAAVLPQSVAAWNPIYMYRSDGYLIAVGDTVGLGKDGNTQKFRVDWTDFYSSSYSQGDTLGFYFKMNSQDLSGENNTNSPYIAMTNAASAWTSYTISGNETESSAWDISGCLGSTSGKGGQNWILTNYHSDNQYYEITLTFSYNDGTLNSLNMTCLSAASMSEANHYYGYATGNATYYLVAWPAATTTDFTQAYLFPFSVDRQRENDDYYYGERYTLHIQNFFLKQQDVTFRGEKFYQQYDSEEEIYTTITSDVDHQYFRFSVIAAHGGKNAWSVNNVCAWYNNYSTAFNYLEYCLWLDDRYVPCIEDLITPYDIDADTLNSRKYDEDLKRYVLNDSTHIATNHVFGRIKGTDYGYYGSSSTSPDSVYYVKFGSYQPQGYAPKSFRYANSMWIDLDDCGQSMTFTLIPDTAVHMFIEFNESTFGDDDWANGYDPNGYYVIGNFTSAKTDVSIDPYASDDNRKKMTKWYYKNGIARETTDELSALFNATIVEATPITDYATDGNGSRLASGFKLYNWGDTLSDGSVVVDSVLYVAQVRKPDLGWGNLYVDFVGATDYEQINSSWVNNEEAWKKVIRPQSSWQVAIDEGVFGADCTALQGGLFKNDNVAYQSINPVVSDTVQTAVFSINITTSTYHVSLLSDTVIYITGPAVDAASMYTNDGTIKQNANWTTESGGSTYTYGIPLTKFSGNDYYAYYVINGTDTTETAIPMSGGELFTFNTNLDFANITYQEDAVTPVYLLDEELESSERTTYKATANGNNYDTQYVNYLAEGQGLTASSYYDASVNASTWGLPTGSYYIRLYLGVKDGDRTTNFYTVTRSYDFNCPDAYGFSSDDDDTSSEQPNAFKVFCDYNAVVVPSDVNVYYVPKESTPAEVSNYDDSSDAWYYKPYTISLKEYDFSGNSDRVLPGNTPVILGTYVDRDNYFDDNGDYSNEDDTSVTLVTGTSKLLRKTLTMEYYGEPNISWSDISASDTIASALTPCIEYEVIPAYQTLTYTDSEVKTATRTVTSDDGTTLTETYYYVERTYTVSTHTFIFGYKTLRTTDEKPTIGFFYSSGNSAINGAYLQVSGDDIPYSWTWRLECDAEGNVTTSSDGTTESGKPALLFYDMTSNGNDIGNDGDGDVTGISCISTDSDDSDAPFYTLQGVRLAGAPTQRGVYIRSGRKVVVK